MEPAESPAGWADALARLGYTFDPLDRARLAGAATPDGAAWVTPLASLGAVAFTGRDTTKFLQAQLTADVAGVEPGHWLPAAWCDPKGRALALFIACVVSTEHVVLIAPVGVLDAVMPKLGLYILRAKTRPARLEGDQSLLGRSVPGDGTATGVVELQGDGALIVHMGDSRSLVLDDTARQVARLEASVDERGALTDEQAWWRDEVLAGRPQVWPETMGAFVPQMTNLEIIGGVSFSKGCYPGQEVVARTQYLGRLKRRTFHASLAVHGDAPLPGTDVRTAEGQEAGRVMQSAVSDARRADMLVVLRTELVDAGTPLYIAGHDDPLSVAPPPYGLEAPADLTALR